MMWFESNAMGFFGWTMMILFWVTIVVLVIWAVRSATATKNRSESDALDILERRYAGGEIEKEEFEERKRILVESRRTGS
ncbi:MAG TPA: SHOCT domain-containing protein [Acidimicrobiia bacterium]